MIEQVERTAKDGREGIVADAFTDGGRDEAAAVSDEEAVVAEQASRLESSLPAVMRQLFAPDPNHPLAELPLGQFRLCILLFREGRRTMSQVGEELSISVSAVTQMADRLERAGMVERVAEPGGDRRTRFLQLTEHGQSLMETRRLQRHARAIVLLKQLAPEQRESVLDALDVLKAAAKSLGPPPPSSARDGDPATS